MRMDSSGQGYEVLVVDDSPVYRKLVETTLSSQQYSILLAKDGREAMELFAQHLPPLVITDWQMPDLSGIELCQKIRAEYQNAYTYLILLTGMSEKDNIVAGLAAGANDYLTKPFHAGELLARIGVGRRFIELQRQLEAKNRLLEEAALTDPLTGLPNRRAVESSAPRELLAAARHGYPLWVVAVDLDHFKNVNDTFGHDAGDVVLRRFGQILKTQTRASNICGRMGGEEFLLILTHVAADNVLAAVNRLRKEFEAQKFNFEGKTVTVTASFGVAGFQGKVAPEFTRLVIEADKALYLAKHEGRNQVKIAEFQAAR
jgi:two-component system, cell cycle response regulator